VPDGPIDDPGAFTSHPRWQRMLIGVAGPVANFILALALMFFYYGWINEVAAHEVKTTTIEWVVPNTPAGQAGLQAGDVITHFDTVNHPDWDQVDQQAALDQGQTVAVNVERGGNPLALSMHLPPAVKGQDFDVTDVGLIPEFVPGPIGVQSVVPGTPAALAGLQAGDQIQTVDGLAFHWVPTLQAYLKAGAGKPITLIVSRNGAVQPPLVVHPEKQAEGWQIGFNSTSPPFGAHPLPLNAAFRKAGKFCKNSSSLIVEVLGRIFTHKVSVSQLSGPVGIARMAGDAAEMKGWFPKFGLAASISINLGILNLMPFPILDGGLILLLMIESVIRRDIGVAIKERIYQAAFVVLIAFFAFIIFNDVTRLPIFTHIKP
jgi:regulator of sigma E protease